MAINQETIKKVIVTVIMATILIAILPGLIPGLITNVTTLGNRLNSSAVTAGDTNLASFFLNVDNWFLWGIAASIVIFLLVLAFGLFSAGMRKYQGYRGRRFR